MNQTPSTILPTPQSAQSSSPQQTLVQKSNHTLIYILVLAVGIISLLILGGVYFVSTQKPSTDAINSLPVSSDNPYLSDIGLFHIFIGQLIDVRSTPKGQQLITDIKGEGIPDFILTESTKILIREPSGKVSIGVLQDLKKGDTLQLSANYDLRSKRWSITLVKAVRTGFKNPPTSSSASANPSP